VVIDEYRERYVRVYVYIYRHDGGYTCCVPARIHYRYLIEPFKSFDYETRAAATVIYSENLFFVYRSPERISTRTPRPVRIRVGPPLNNLTFPRHHRHLPLRPVRFRIETPLLGSERALYSQLRSYSDVDTLNSIFRRHTRRIRARYYFVRILHTYF